jgi:hypothetical protein
MWNPDFWVGDNGTAPCEGHEIKSLALSNARPARKDYDSNSTMPSGQKEGRDVFLVSFLYTGSGDSPRPVHSFVVAHGDLINADHAAAAAHVNEGISGFGSYGDGFIRDRKMYHFPHPFTLDPAGIGRCRIIAPWEWGLADARIQKVGILERSISATTLESYSIHLDGKTKPTTQGSPRPNAGMIRRFDIFEHG